MAPNLRRKRGSLLRTFALLTGCALALFSALWMFDYATSAMPPAGARGPVSLLFGFDPVTLQSALANLAAIIAAVLGIAITVVSIVVQLAANRYTPRVVDMFFRDRINQGVMGFFVVACVVAVWVSMVVTGVYTPFATVIVTVALASSCLLILIPYFAYVFDFLDPEKVIDRLGQQTLQGALGQTDALMAGEESTSARQRATVTSMEQLADIAINALAQKDKVIAADATSALRRVLVDYLPQKKRLPAPWFAIGPGLLENPDFVAMDKDSVADLAAKRIWLEWKGLRQFREIYSEALKNMPEMAHVVAIETRYVGEASLASDDPAVLSMTLKFMNTYLRAALNAGDVRSAYNLLNQYRQLAESMLRATASQVTPALIEIGGYFKYYAQLAQRMGLGFVAETAAYDLCALCEAASELGAASHDRLLAIVLEIDKQAETDAEEKALRGVRKAQAKLAAYYLVAGREAHARMIHRDMAAETAERLRSIRDEMLSITSKEFWEVIDRGTNFDYLDERRKQKLREFFEWFGELKGAVA
jgi:hypothetical protein